ncbi:hypothetical protein EYF80_020847 [Liparis tanakae]|uniref:Uncharacterized protein n=1 Tax=Liparis tanakae TaxID=230148 RepID=A0A4Z2HT01_9TELE|nr:hypothetical protein EYF80_020847 [Liparis tanakae]
MARPPLGHMTTRETAFATFSLTSTLHKVMAWFGIQHKKKDNTTMTASQYCPPGNLSKHSFSPVTLLRVEKIDVGAVARDASVQIITHVHLAEQDLCAVLFFSAEATDQ